MGDWIERNEGRAIRTKRVAAAGVRRVGETTVAESHDKRWVDRIAKPLGLKRSEIVRQALRQWLRARAVEGLEKEWIAPLESRPDDADRAEAWLAVQTWTRR
jgi:hypothetical protein